MQPIQPILAGPAAPLYPGPIDPGPMGYTAPSQPATKKQKKSGASMGPPVHMPRQASTPGSVGSKASGHKNKARTAPSTPVGAPIVANPHGFKTQQVKASAMAVGQPIKPGMMMGISPQSFQRVMQRPGPEMEAYFQVTRIVYLFVHHFLHAPRVHPDSMRPHPFPGAAAALSCPIHHGALPMNQNLILVYVCAGAQQP